MVIEKSFLSGKKIIICEYCGRILVADPDGAEE